MRAHEVYIPIMGFTQHTDRVTGTEKIWRKLRKLSSPHVWVFPPLCWDSDWAAIARLIANNTEPDPQVRIISYSWGAGHGFVRLAEELDKHGIEVIRAVLADPVHRSRCLPMRWRSLVNSGPLAPVIRVPGNVRNVVRFRQRTNKPQAHEMVAERPGFTYFAPWVDIEAKHEHMDDAPEFAEAALLT